MFAPHVNVLLRDFDTDLKGIICWLLVHLNLSEDVYTLYGIIWKEENKFMKEPSLCMLHLGEDQIFHMSNSRFLYKWLNEDTNKLCYVCYKELFEWLKF